MSTSDFPTDLRAELKARRMSQRALSGATNIEEATISRYCNGLAPTEQNAARIVRALEEMSSSAETVTSGTATVTEAAA
jgi:transcriptional regulator with XRE-family HTH domain